MYGYIYETTNLVNGKRYIGRHKSDGFDPSYKGSGKHLGNAIRKYGWDNFSTSLLIPCFSEEELNAEEELLIDFFNCVASPEYYNEYPGGHGGFPAGEFSPNYGKKQSDETIAKRIEKLRGRTFSEESRAQIAANLTGRKHSAETRRRMSESHKGKRSGFEVITSVMNLREGCLNL